MCSLVSVDTDCLFDWARFGFAVFGGRSGNSSVLVSMEIDGRVGLVLLVRGPRERSTFAFVSRCPMRTSR